MNSCGMSACRDTDMVRGVEFSAPYAIVSVCVVAESKESVMELEVGRPRMALYG